MSYVKTAQVHTTKLGVLRPYRTPRRTRRRQNIYLSDNSYNQLVKFSQYSVRSPDSGSRPVVDHTVWLPASRIPPTVEEPQHEVRNVPHGERIGRQAAVDFFVYPQGRHAQARHDEGTSLLPYSTPGRRRQRYVSSSRPGLNWYKVFAVIIGSVVILAICYGIYWACLKIYQLALSCWHWLEHLMNGEGEAIKA